MRKPGSSMISFRIEDDLRDRMDSAINGLCRPDALNRKIGQSELLRMALEEYLQKLEDREKGIDGPDADHDSPEAPWAMSIPIEEGKKRPPLPKMPQPADGQGDLPEALWE